MNFSRLILDGIARSLRMPSPPSGKRRILVIRRNRLGDMICTLPLLHALRNAHPDVHLAVACDPPGATIARACAAVDEVLVLGSGWNRWVATIRNASRLQGFDCVIAAKGGFDRRLAALARLTNAPRRIGFGPPPPRTSSYTDPVPLPDHPHDEHQIETTLRLLQPFGIAVSAIDLSLSLPMVARDFASVILARPPFADAPRFLLLNLSSTAPLKFRPDDFAALAARIVGNSDFSIGLVAAPADQAKAREFADRLASPRIAAVTTPGPLELAALLEKAAFLLTPEGGAAHLAAAMKRPALVLWSEGPFGKWRSRGPNHTFIQAVPGEAWISPERVWSELQAYLA